SGIYRIVRGRVNTYVLNDVESYITVIDTGFPGTTPHVMQLVHDIGRVPQDVRHILITHADLDHIGDLRSLVKATGARVYASAASQTFLKRRRSPPHLRLTTKVIADSVGFFVLNGVHVDHIVADGDMLDIAGGIRVIATPGHTPDHVSYFWQRERALFAGDLICNLADGLSLVSDCWMHDITAARQSAASVLALDPAIICPGHGEIWLASQAPAQIELLRIPLSAKNSSQHLG
ncbi:MAG: MBL fold metallo-hydrolase, partial [Chloroflexota bacterium]